jgi:hypothetical protein
MSVSNLMSLDDVKSATSKTTNLTYVQRPPDKSVQGAAFSEGDITFDFTVGGNRWWIPSKTHFVIRAKVEKFGAAGGAIDDSDKAAPAQLFAANLFQACDFRIEGRSVSKVSNRVAQVQAIKQRLTKSIAWRGSVGASLNFDLPEHKDRLEAVSSDSSGRPDLEVVWQPPCAIFDQDTPLPPGNYSIVLTPNTNYQKAAIYADDTTDDKGKVTVGQMHLYIAQVDGMTPPADFTYYLDLQEVDCTPQSIKNLSEQLEFNVKPSTYALTVAMQSSNAGADQRYSQTQFTNRATTAAGVTSDDHLGLTQLRIQYASQTQPSPDANPNYAAGIDYMSRMYSDTMLNSNMYFSLGGVEDKKSWLAQGPVFHYTFLKPQGDTSKHVSVSFTYKTATAANLLLFSWYSNIAQITYSQGRITGTQVESA